MFWYDVSVSWRLIFKWQIEQKNTINFKLLVLTKDRTPKGIDIIRYSLFLNVFELNLLTGTSTTIFFLWR